MIKFIKKYPQSTAYFGLLILLAFHAVMGWQYSENADRKFWWKFWEISAVASAIMFAGAIIWAVTKRKRFDED